MEWNVRQSDVSKEYFCFYIIHCEIKLRSVLNINGREQSISKIYLTTINKLGYFTFVCNLGHKVGQKV